MGGHTLAAVLPVHDPSTALRNPPPCPLLALLQESSGSWGCQLTVSYPPGRAPPGSGGKGSSKRATENLRLYNFPTRAEAAVVVDLLRMWRQHRLGRPLNAMQYNLGLERYRCAASATRMGARLLACLVLICCSSSASCSGGRPANVCCPYSCSSGTRTPPAAPVPPLLPLPLQLLVQQAACHRAGLSDCC